MSNVINIEAERILAPYYDTLVAFCNVSKQDIRDHVSSHEYTNEQLMCAQDLVTYVKTLIREEV